MTRAIGRLRAFAGGQFDVRGFGHAIQLYLSLGPQANAMTDAHSQVMR